MSSNLLVKHQERIPGKGALIIPSTISPKTLRELRKVLGARKLQFLTQAGGEVASSNLLDDEDAIIHSVDLSGESAGAPDALKQAVDAGDLVLFLPCQCAHWPAQLLRFPSEQLAGLLQLGIPTVPVFIDEPTESALTIEEGHLQEISIVFGELLEPEKLSISSVQGSLFEGGYDSFSERPLLKQSLAYAVVRGLKRNGGTKKIIDGMDGSELGFDKLLAASIALSKLIRKATNKKRVGIILPPGKGGLVANVATLLAGKIPININFTAGESSINSAISQADLDYFLTAGPFVEKLETFPWPSREKRMHLEEVLPKLKPKIIFWLLVSKALSPEALLKKLGVSELGGHEEATILFTSGSSGEPKGVVLSHRNLLSNVAQFGSRLGVRPEDNEIMLGCLPLFHSFGCTVTMWYPILEGIDIVTYPNPLEAQTLADLIEKHKVTVQFSTPTFLRGFLRKIDPAKMKSVRLLVVGAEKLPLRLAETFKKKMGIDILEGYGLTETSPVTNVNVPNLEPHEGNPVLESRRLGTTGHLMPGLTLRITDPSTDEILPLNESGMIWFKGPNVFEEYFNQPEKTAEVKKDGWFRTGDLGRLDEDGFLHIEGRLSRFSKIGGEMVPHETVEDSINKVLGLDGESERKIAVSGIPDEAKGEALVLLATPAISQDQNEIRKALLEAGIPALWIPKKRVRIEAIPLLATGKLDLKGCEEAARGAAKM